MESSTRALIEKRLKEYEVGSVQHTHYMQILRELDAKEPIKLHKAEEAVCTSCE